MESNALLEKYQELLNVIEKNKSHFKEELVCVFNISKGKNFKENGIIFYGRATNGWGDGYDKNTISSKIDEIENSLEKDSTDWVVDDWGNNKGTYDPNRSQFWRVVRNTSIELVGIEGNQVLKEIAWSNLYKVAKEGEGNPSQRLMNTQFEVASEILKLELDIYKPKVAIFLTSLGWASPFLEYLGVEKLEKNQALKYVEVTAKYNDTIIVVGQHPQGKPEEEHKIEILTSIQNAKEHFRLK